MPGGSGQAYLSEDARKEAQRRMLADKYGLASSDEDDDDQSDTATSGGGEGSSSASSADHPGAPSVPSAPAALKEHSLSRASGTVWPGALLADPMSAGAKLPIVYRYRRAEHAETTALRECRVTQVTMYQSMYAESTGRRICVDGRIICYAVGGHVRVLARGSTARCLLKGHESGVVDMELAVVKGDGNVAVLGSVAEDGSVFVWVVNRFEEEDDEDGEAGVVLEKRDSIRLENPRGGSYDRIGFRPVDGAVPSESGIGVAMLLMDRKCESLRVTELVKMGEKTKLRDRELSGGHTCLDGEGLSAAAWLTKSLIATARGGEVCVWSVSGGTVTMKLERDTKSVVSGLHVLQRGEGFVILLVAAENGTVLEVWSLMTGAGKSILVQQLRLEDAGGGGFNVVARDVMSPDFVAVSSLRTKSVFVLHYRQDRACLDAITELPVKEPVLSLCVTKNERKLDTEYERGVQEASSVMELGLWSVHPSSIKMTHVLTSQCVPPVGGKVATLGSGSEKKEEEAAQVEAPGAEAPVPSLRADLVGKAAPATAVSSKSAPVAVVAAKAVPVTLLAKKPVSAVTASSASVAHSAPTTAVAAALKSTDKDAATSSTAQPSASASTATGKSNGTSAAAKAITILKKPAAVTSQDLPADGGKSKGLLSATTPASDSRSSGVVAERSAQWEAKTKDTIDTPESTISVSSTGRKTFTATSAAIDNNSTDESSSGKGGSKNAGNAGSSSAAATSPASGVDEDELLATITAVARTIVAEFDAEGVRHSESEMKKMESLVSSAMARADLSVKKHVSESMKKPMASAIIPVLSEIVSNASAKTAAAQAIASSSARAKVSPEWFARSFRESELNSKFGNACTEMTNQVSQAVKTSMATKYAKLVEPSIKAVEEATTHLSNESKEFVEAMKLSTADALRAGGRMISANGAPSKADEMALIVGRIANMVADGNCTEAFRVALGSKNSDIVLDVASRVDASQFCDSSTLSQYDYLEVARFLGQNLSDQSDLKVRWLEDLMLIIEPADLEIVATAPPILQQLHGNIATLRRDADVISENPALLKRCKKLQFLISTLADG